jgi:hypothetical protein
MATTIQVVVDPKLKRELKALAKAEKRTLSNMVGWLLAIGLDVHKAKEQTT